MQVAWLFCLATNSVSGMANMDMQTARAQFSPRYPHCCLDYAGAGFAGHVMVPACCLTVPDFVGRLVVLPREVGIAAAA